MQSRHKTTRFFGLAACSFTIGAVATPVYANTLEEVVVLAKRRETNLQETVGAITAFSNDALQQLGIVRLADLGTSVPNVSVGEPQFSGTEVISMRGIAGQSGGIGQDDPVAVYLDGVYLGRPQSQQFAMVDIERIEVLKGPQGTLYGRNATAGAINIVTRRPQQTVAGVLEATIGNYDTTRVNGSIEGGLSDTVSGRASLYYQDFGGDLKNTFTGTDERYEEDWYSRVVLEYASQDDRHVVTLALDAGDTTIGTGLKNITVDGNRYIEVDDIALDLEGTELTRDTAGVALTYQGELSDQWRFQSITAYRDLDLDVIYDSDGTNVDAYLAAIPEFVPASIAIIRDTGSYQGISSEQYSQEFQLTYSSGNVDWIFGLFGYREEARHLLTIELLTNSDSPILSTDTDTENTAISYAAYSHLTYAFGDRYELSAGLRYSYEEKSIERQVFSGGMQTNEDLTDSWDDPTGELSLSMDITDGVMGYVSYSQGFKSGGFSSLSRNTPSFAPEYVNSFEAGLKSDLLDNRLRLNVAAFTMDYEDLQVRFPGDVGQLIIQNAAQASIDGLEIDATALLTENLSLVANFGYLDATYDDYSYEGVDYSGNRLNQAPEYSVFAALDYERDIASLGTVRAFVSYSWQDEEFFRPENDPLNGNQGFEKLDARLGLSPRAMPGFTFELWAQNLTDDRYVGAVVPLVADQLYYASINRPRTYGLRMVYSF